MYRDPQIDPVSTARSTQKSKVERRRRNWLASLVSRGHRNYARYFGQPRPMFGANFSSRRVANRREFLCEPIFCSSFVLWLCPPF